MTTPAEAEVRATFQQFQEGYTQRELENLDTFMELFVPEASLEVIGTSAASLTDNEWCLDRPAVRALIEADWRDWGDLKLDVAGARIHVVDNVAWLATAGTVTQTIPLSQIYGNITHYLQGVLAHQTDLNVEHELLNVILGAATALNNTRYGNLYIWPIRFTAVLVRQQDRWRFHQIHFSFPTIHDPDVRLP